VSFRSSLRPRIRRPTSRTPRTSSPSLSLRGPRATLYENISLIAQFVPELDAYEPDDVAIFENQGITEYTTRLFNRRLIWSVGSGYRCDRTTACGRSRTDFQPAL